MRNAFAQEMVSLAGADPRIHLLSGDIGNKLFDSYKARFADRFLNCGVAEANMISMAAGMSSCGLRPVAYTINAFLTARCYEQIRVDLCYHNAPVVLVGVGGGLSYASLGATHHSCEDIAILRVLPRMTVICPADPVETRLALREAVRHDGPVYLRLGKKGEPVVHRDIPAFEIGKAIVVRPGDEVCLLGTGTVLPVCIQAAEELGRHGVSAEVVSFHTVKPLDTETLNRAFSRFDLVATVEEHSLLGGLGGSVAEWCVSQSRVRARLVRIGTPDAFVDGTGGEEHARRTCGLTPDGVAREVLRFRTSNGSLAA